MTTTQELIDGAHAAAELALMRGDTKRMLDHLQRAADFRAQEQAR